MHPKDYLEKLFALKEKKVTEENRSSFDDFCKEEQYLNKAIQIMTQQEILMTDWTLKLRIDDIIRQQVRFPNGTVGKSYVTKLDFEMLGWLDIITYEWEGLDSMGLTYDKRSNTISGTPVHHGDFKIELKFRIFGEEEKEDWHYKMIPLIINPDPKSLWKDKPSDKEQLFWRKDEVNIHDVLGEKEVVISSKRGRAHANVGSFRDDDFAYQYFKSDGWGLVAVSDGAGSAKYSREGARLACSSVIDYFRKKIDLHVFSEFDDLLVKQQHSNDEETRKAINLFLYNNLGGAAKNAYNELLLQSKEIGAEVKDFHATLIFVLFKRYSFGYVVLSFGVGDCPIGLVYDNQQEVCLMNTMDVGEFGGGTRFITMPEIFQANDFSSRMGFKIVPDFDYLILMTDGIYDPKFEVEANLVKVEKWIAFIEDIKGNNPDDIKVNLNKGNIEIGTELGNWMNFWSPGNHDDRTLAIIF